MNPLLKNSSVDSPAGSYFRVAGQLILGACCLTILAGCGTVVEDEEEPPIVEDHADALFPIMMHNKVIRHGRYAWKLQLDDITDVVLHERSEPEADGTRTAIISFTMESNGLRVKASVTYKPVEGQSNDKSHTVATFPVATVKALSVGR